MVNLPDEREDKKAKPRRPVDEHHQALYPRGVQPRAVNSWGGVDYQRLQRELELVRAELSGQFRDA
jgi:hypothetical protein